MEVLQYHECTAFLQNVNFSAFTLACRGMTVANFQARLSVTRLYSANSQANLNTKKDTKQDHRRLTIVKTLRLFYTFKITCSCLLSLISCFSSSFNPIKEKFQLLFHILTLYSKSKLETHLVSVTSK